MGMKIAFVQDQKTVPLRLANQINELFHSLLGIIRLGNHIRVHMPADQERDGQTLFGAKISGIGEAIVSTNALMVIVMSNLSGFAMGIMENLGVLFTNIMENNRTLESNIGIGIVVEQISPSRQAPVHGSKTAGGGGS